MGLEWNVFFIPYAQAVHELRQKFLGLRKEYIQRGMLSPIEAVSARVKSVDSIMRKVEKKKISVEQIDERIEDIAGIRILCRFVTDIEKVVELIRARDGFDLRVTEERDYITNSKPSGYRSYHILTKYPVVTINGPKEVPAEIQIRTVVMNYWADIEHSLNYKYDRNIPLDLQKRLISSAAAAYRLDRDIDAIREEIAEYLHKNQNNGV